MRTTVQNKITFWLDLPILSTIWCPTHSGDFHAYFSTRATPGLVIGVGSFVHVGDDLWG
jgi:hypothetical protein